MTLLSNQDKSINVYMLFSKRKNKIITNLNPWTSDPITPNIAI